MDIKAKPKDRQSSTGIDGSPKKGGAGGKGTWGVGGLDDLKAVAIADPGDPNYDSEDESEEVVIVKMDITSPIEVLIREFFTSGDVDETIKSLKELRIDDKHDQLVKKFIISGMEKKAYERELVSKLLSSIYNNPVTPEQITEGFQAALNALEDAILDTPDGVDVLSKFLARAIIDEVVAPAFLTHVVVENPLAEQCLALAHSLLNQPFRSERLAHIWGAGAITSVKKLKEETTLVFEEFLTNGDFQEADHSVRELNVPHFHPQLVKQALRLALAKDEEDRKKILSLLAVFSKNELLSKEHVKKGFSYCIESLDDLTLDVPNASNVLQGFIHAAKAEGWLDSSFEEPKA